MFLLFVGELILYWIFVSKYGFWTVTGYYWLPTAISLLLFLIFGPFLFLNLKMKFMTGQLMREVAAALAQTRVPFFSVRILNTLAIITGLAFLLVPLVTTRIIGLILVLPVARHLILWKFSRNIFSKIQNELSKRNANPQDEAGSGFGKTGGFGGFKYYYKSYGPGGQTQSGGNFSYEDSSEMRDVTGTDKPVEPKLISDKNSDS